MEFFKAGLFILTGIMTLMPTLRAQQLGDCEQHLDQFIANESIDSLILCLEQVAMKSQKEDPSLVTFYTFFKEKMRPVARSRKTGFFKELREAVESLKQEVGSSSHALQIMVASEYGAALYYDRQYEAVVDVLSTIDLQGVHPDLVAHVHSDLLSFQGLSHRRLGQYDHSASCLERTAENRLKVFGPISLEVAGVYTNLGNTYILQGRYDRAEQVLRQSLELKESLAPDNKGSHISTLNALGGLYDELGHYEKAIEHYQKGRAAARTIGHTTYEFIMLTNMGVPYFNMGAFQESLDIYSQALSMGEQNPEVIAGYEHSIYQNLANAHSKLGDLDQALDYQHKAYDRVTLNGTDAEFAAIANALGLVYHRKKNHQSSLRYFQEALDIYSRLGLSSELANVYSDIATAYGSIGQIDTAVHYQIVAIAIQDTTEISDLSLRAFSYNAAARYLMINGDLDSSIIYLDRAIDANRNRRENANDIVEQCLSPSVLFESYLLKGSIAKQNDDFEQAGAFFDLADSILVVQRRTLFDATDKINFTSNSKKLATQYLDLCVMRYRDSKDLGFIHRAYEIAEKTKSTVLLQSLMASNVSGVGGVPDSLIEREADLLSKVKYYKHQWEIGVDEVAAESHRTHYFNNREAHKLLVREMEAAYPDYYKLKYREEPTGILHIQSKISKETAVLSYLISDSIIYRWMIAPDQVVLDRLDKSDGFNDLLIGYRKGISLRLDDVYYNNARLLHDLLIPKTLPEQISKLIIVPDGGLAQIPFEAFLSKETDMAASLQSWPYLLKDFDIQYVPSMTLWMELQDKSIKEDISMLAIAPVFTNETSYSSNMNTLAQLDRGGFDASMHLTPLPATASEVNALDKLFTASDLTFTSLLFNEASEARFKDERLTEYSHIHIATHGFVDEHNPRLSGLILAQIPSDAFDNVLYVAEVYNIDLDADLVTLSACETGLGKMAEGEGVMGFSRSFLYAGARNLLLSFWKVNDASTNEFMVDFYTQITRYNLDHSSALRMTKLKMITSNTYGHPYYWAPFVLIGPGG